MFSTVSVVEFEQFITYWKCQFKLLYLYVDQCLTLHGYNVFTNSHHSLEKIKNIHRKMFSQTNYTKQDSNKNHLALAKTNHVFKYTLSAQKCYS